MPQRNLCLYNKENGEALATGTRRELKIWLRNSTTYGPKNVVWGPVIEQEAAPAVEPKKEPEVTVTSMENEPKTEGFLKKIFN